MLLRSSCIKVLTALLLLSASCRAAEPQSEDTTVVKLDEDNFDREISKLPFLVVVSVSWCVCVKGLIDCRLPQAHRGLQSAGASTVAPCNRYGPRWQTGCWAA